MTTTDISRADTTLPTVTGETMLSEADLAALRRAVQALERPSLAARLSAAAGAPLDIIGRSLPAPVTEVVSRSTEAAMRGALRVALATLPRTELAPATGGETLGTATAKAESRITRLLGSGDAKHKAYAALSGAIGGAFGLSTLAVELPVSTTLMLRSIAEIAREAGEDLETPEGALACVQVFALGGGRAPAANLAESGYFAVRGVMARTLSEAVRYAGQKGLAGESAPALVRYAAQVASRFGIVVSQKVAAQAVPVIGALGGAAVNTAFMDHFQAIARAHFTVRRLERAYGREAVHAAYERERATLPTA